jgi:predicted nucleotidyltransferase
MPAGRDPLKPSLRSAVQAVAGALSALPVPGMLIGGIAVISRGVPRLTRDVDITIAGGRIGVDDLIDRLREHGLAVRIDDAAAFAAANQVLLLRHEPSGVDVDLSLAWLPFELEALNAADVLDVAGIRVAVARAEDLVVYKAVAFRPQDQQDIERLLVLHGPGMDLTRVRRLVAEFAAALDEPERQDAFEQIVRRSRLG